jgi:hypothetical protein
MVEVRLLRVSTRVGYVVIRVPYFVITCVDSTYNMHVLGGATKPLDSFFIFPVIFPPLTLLEINQSLLIKLLK